MKLTYLACCVILIAMMVGSIAPAVQSQAVFVTVPQPHVSARNQIIDFYAGGTSEGYTIRVSPQGGTLTINDYLSMSLMPWGYVSTKWSTGQMYIIFLVNVTETDFRIGFLYLTNSTNEAFILRWFDYQSGAINNWTFQGAQHVFNRTVTTASIELPKLHISTSATVTNQISALGPDMYLDSKGGVLVNDTRSLRIYPLLNQLFGGPNDYNEVWSLLTDETGAYYFAILYMPNEDSSHVIIEHQVRLNDYQKLNGRTANARWVKGTFENQVTVRTSMHNLTVKLDGYPFQTNQYGIASARVPNGIVTLEVPNEIYDSPNSKVKFHSWGKYGESNPLVIRVNSTLDITAQYDHAYPLVVVSAYGTPQGADWYAEGTNASFSVPGQVNYGNETRELFVGWQGDSNSTNNQAWLIVNAAKQVTAIWQTQYEVTIAALGIPPNVVAFATIGSFQVKLNGSTPYKIWVNANDQLPITVQSIQIQNQNSSYYFTELRGDGQAFTGPLRVGKPLEVSLVYSQTVKQLSTISLQVFPPVGVTGIPVSITGSINGLTDQHSVVDIQYTSANNEWQDVASVPVAHNGAFICTWQPGASGSYSIKAYWPGDSKYSSAIRVVDIRVIGSSFSSPTGSGDLAQFISSGMAVVRASPYLSTLIAFAASLMMLGYLASSFIGGPPIVGYFIGSVLLGFVFVFPLSAALVVLRATKTRRKPSLLWLVPLITSWGVSLAITILAPAVAPSEALILAAEILLVASTVFVIPLLAAFGLAKLIA